MADLPQKYRRARTGEYVRRMITINRDVDEFLREQVNASCLIETLIRDEMSRRQRQSKRDNL